MFTGLFGWLRQRLRGSSNVVAPPTIPVCITVTFPLAGAVTAEFNTGADVVTTFFTGTTLVVEFGDCET